MTRRTEDSTTCADELKKLVKYHGSYTTGLTYEGTLGTVEDRPECEAPVRSHLSARESARIVRRLKSKKRKHHANPPSSRPRRRRM